ncbi:MAG: hypothetical protein FWF57_09670 [Defluviitaleaceae bacterium]|nr:hypothetical protein [Defluviitaleaceae bacterium]
MADRLNNLTTEQAVIKGSMEQKVDTARKLLKEGHSCEQVAEYTGLKLEAVENLE